MITALPSQFASILSTQSLGAPALVVADIVGCDRGCCLVARTVTALPSQFASILTMQSLGAPAVVVADIVGFSNVFRTITALPSQFASILSTQSLGAPALVVADIIGCDRGCCLVARRHSFAVPTDDLAQSASIDDLARPKCGPCVISAIWEAIRALCSHPLKPVLCLESRIYQPPSTMPPKRTSSTQKRANQRTETASTDFVMRTRSGLPINQRMILIFIVLDRTTLKRTSVTNFDDYSALLSRRAKISTATTDPRIDTESETQDHPKIDDPVTEDESNGEGELEAHKGDPVDDPKACESLPVSDTPEDEDASSDGTPSTDNNYPYANRRARSRAEHRAKLAARDLFPPDKESDKGDDEYQEDEEDEDEEVPAPPSKAKLFKKRALSNTSPKNSTVIETSLTAPVQHRAKLAGRDLSPLEEESDGDDDEYKEDEEASDEEDEVASDEEAPAPPSKAMLFKKSALSNTLPPSALPKNSMAMETASPTPQLYSFDDVGEDLPIASRPGRLCQEGVHDAQELGRKTLEAAKAIGAKYGKSARTILIEAGLSVKHSRAETPWNMHQGWYKSKYPREKDEQLSDWKKRQRDHYYSLPDDDPLWDDVQAYHEVHLGGANNNQSRASIVMSTRDALAKRFAAYSRLEGIEVIGCVFDSTPDEAARQASGFVAGSSTFMDLINERQVDARLALDWIITAVKVKNYQLVLPRFSGAYDILFSKPGEAPRDRYRHIWSVMVLEKLEQFGYKPKSVQWRKLLDVAYQNKFQFELWPDGVHPVGPDFNYHTLSAQQLKLLVVPYIKRKATQYYDAELKTEATNLLELRRKQGRSDKTLDDIIDELDVTVSEIDIVPWPQDHIDQCENDDPRMFDIPLVTSASHIVLRKLADSEKFKYSVPKMLLEQYKEATSTTQQQTHRAARGFSIVHEDHHSNNDPPRTEHHPAVLQPQRMQPRKRLHVEDYDQTFESEADSLNAPDSRIRKKSKVLILILILDLDLDLVHLPLAMSHLNNGIMWPILAMIFQLQALQEWLQGDMRTMLMAGTLRLLIMLEYTSVLWFQTVLHDFHSKNNASIYEFYYIWVIPSIIMKVAMGYPRVIMAIPADIYWVAGSPQVVYRGIMRSSASGWLKLNESYGIGSCAIKIIKVDFMENNNGDQDGKDN
ncbi:hypothetical protein DEU56DRAFT_754299 [Suillus clintonianus]|uniref:uncharacterized protein n=1 Tax=Suillus clintonianus TaxID=1904413 RepID=UPI001B87FF86|nr:uncharacterized protein DEU56DRAFT_754299 [Suillus clintonianus]KAG2144234.1 hypothetical protein DEU56DRAFT_754299 [Suillus clintonianus]